MMTKNISLQENEKVFLPPYGVGMYVGKEEIDIDGEVKFFLKVKFDSDNTVSMVPEDKFQTSGMRKLASKATANKVLELLQTSPKLQKGLWNKKMQEYDAKIYSGSIFSIAEVLRDSFSCSFDPSKSYTERSKYKKALDIVVQEFSAIFKKDYESMEAEIISLLQAKQMKKDQNVNDDEFDEDFEDYAKEEPLESEEFNEEKFFSNSKR